MLISILIISFVLELLEDLTWVLSLSLGVTGKKFPWVKEIHMDGLKLLQKLTWVLQDFSMAFNSNSDFNSCSVHNLGNRKLLCIMASQKRFEGGLLIRVDAYNFLL